jgi:hypothetical protein
MADNGTGAAFDVFWEEPANPMIDDFNKRILY